MIVEEENKSKGNNKRMKWKVKWRRRKKAGATLQTEKK